MTKIGSLDELESKHEMPNENKDENSSAFKNWIDAAYLNRLAKALAGVDSKIDVQQITLLSDRLGPFALKARVRLVSETLREILPPPSRAIPLLTKAVIRADLKGFDLWPLTQFIESYGLEEFEISMAALHELTRRFTAEFAIRPFLVHHEKATLAKLETWTKDTNPHVRRLVSEGTRSRLPWALRLDAYVRDPRRTVKLLEKLKYDEETYVRKSVANHLNDISKDHPDLAISILEKWNAKIPTEHSEKITWITKHALRTLIKSGHPGALALVGVKQAFKAVEISSFRVKKSVIRVNESLEFSFDLRSKAKEPTKLIVDYVIHHRKANGDTSEKVFKLKTFTLLARQTITIAKRHPVRLITTRKYYAGAHAIEIQINGRRFNKTLWRLVVPSSSNQAVSK